MKLPCTAVQLASLTSAAVFTSGALFVYYCSARAPGMAAWQPPLVYGGLLAFLLFPNNIVYKARTRLLQALIPLSAIYQSPGLGRPAMTHPVSRLLTRRQPMPLVAHDMSLSSRRRIRCRSW